MKPVFSIIIPAYNSRLTLELVIRCLEAQTFPRDQFECLIANDGSKDGTLAFLQGYRPGVNLRYFSHPINLGRSHARNTGCAHAEGDFLVFLDADMLPDPDWLVAYHSAMSQTPELDVLSGGRYHIHLGANPDNRPQALAQKLGTLPGELFVGQVREQFERLQANAQLGMYPGYAMAKIETQLPQVCQQYPESLLCAYALITSNVTVRRSAFEKTGGFDVSMRRTEDTDLGVRLWELRARFGCVPDARAYHMYHSGQGDRNNTLLERQTFFYRHPYLLIVLLNLWFAYHDRPDPAPPSSTFASLLTLIVAGPKLLDIDLSQEFYRIYRQPAWTNCVCDRDLMIGYYWEHTGIPRAEIEAYLDQAIAQGLVTQRRNQRLYFDFDHTTRWLQKSSTYQQYELEHTRYSWIRNWIPNPPLAQSPTSASDPASPQKRDGEARRAPLSFRCRGIYEVNLSPEVLAGVSLEGTLNMPLPVEHACQTDVQIVRCEPETLLDYADPGRTMISNFPMERARDLDGGVTIRYEFECNLREHLLVENNAGLLHSINNTRYLKPTYPAAQLPKAEALLKKILAGSVQDAYSTAYTIYTWILNNRRYLQNFLADYLVMETGFGSCIHLARLFVNLCRLMRIPAREQSGVPFGRIVAPNTPLRTVVAERAYNILTHTWAEFYTPQYGWSPVELSSADFGRHILTATNVKDERLRDQMIRETDLYANYYFGNLDPFRLYAGEPAQVPTYPLIRSKLSPEALKTLVLQTRHRLICDVSGNAEFGDLWDSLQKIDQVSYPRVAPERGRVRDPVRNGANTSEPSAEPLPAAPTRSPKCVVITSMGSTGDVQPLLGLANELRRSGSEITFALPSIFRQRIESLGFRFTEIGAGTGLDAWHKIFARQTEITDPIEQTRYFVEALAPLVPQMFRELREICAEADVLIAPPFQLVARMLHDAMGIPFVSIHFSPFGSKGGKAIREISAPIVNQVRQQAGLPPLEDPLGADGVSPQLALYPVSRHVFRAPAQWPAHQHITGYFYFDEETWQPDPELVRFVEMGPPPVVITFGSMPNQDPAALTDLVLEAIAQMGCRAVLQSGQAGLGRGRVLPDNIYVAGFLPHRWLFPRAACIIHHGGAGTTAAAFRAGVPAVIVPHVLDQPIWGEYARALGCASAVIQYKQLTAERLKFALMRALSEERYRRTAAILGEKIRSENGVETARKLIEKGFATWKGMQ